MTNLRTYQKEMHAAVFDAWGKGAKVVMAVSATGSGKTVTAQAIASDVQGEGCAVAHRRELVGQLSLQWAKAGIPHNIIAPKATRDTIIRRHMKRFGRTTYTPHAQWSIASVDTLLKRPNTDGLFDRIENLVGDEGHHFLRHNKWGKAIARFGALKRGVLFTATPERPDGKGLTSWTDGLCDAMIEGPPMRWLIDQGYLLDYWIETINPSDLMVSGVAHADNGDFNQKQLSEAVKKSKAIVGDVVNTYCSKAWGQRWLTFATDLDHAARLLEAFTTAGVPARVVSSESTDDEREQAVSGLDAGTIWNLISVDIFGEGTDLPNVMGISMARPTESFVVYAQEFGRMLRLLISEFQMDMWDTFDVATRKGIIAASPKPRGRCFDHAGNFHRFEGPPDKARVWKFDGRGKTSRKPGDEIPMRGCASCFKPYERYYTACPYCGAEPLSLARGGANEVDGDIYLLDDEYLRKIRGEIKLVDSPMPPSLPNDPKLHHIVRRRHQERFNEQHTLRKVMELWAGTYPDVSNEVNYKRFYLLFGIDVIQAFALGAGEAAALREKISKQMAERGIVVTLT
jgi:superfamily II DNA or RNA helicase